ncbi:MAG: ABC transporter ATP-binding protein, partial [Thermofilaceae archaeon]
MAVIELNDVYFRYQGSDEYALRGVTLSADRGEFIVLVGPSGCGKSTLLRVLNGLIPHFYEGEFRGEARVAGLDVKRTPTHILARHVGMVFQDPENQLFLSSVEREIAFGLENMGLPRSEIKRRVEEALRLFGLEELRDKAPYELSGGQQQKVAIASVMVLEPEVLAMDEPTANLDPLSALEILSLVR